MPSAAKRLEQAARPARPAGQDAEAKARMAELKAAMGGKSLHHPSGVTFSKSANIATFYDSLAVWARTANLNPPVRKQLEALLNEAEQMTIGKTSDAKLDEMVDLGKASDRFAQFLGEKAKTSPAMHAALARAGVSGWETN